MTAKIIITTYNGGPPVEAVVSNGDGTQEIYILDAGATHELTVWGDRQITISEPSNMRVIKPIPAPVAASTGVSVTGVPDLAQAIDFLQRNPSNSAK